VNDDRSRGHLLIDYSATGCTYQVVVPGRIFVSIRSAKRTRDVGQVCGEEYDGSMQDLGGTLSLTWTVRTPWAIDSVDFVLSLAAVPNLSCLELGP
jgi:hypothetical protein